MDKGYTAHIEYNASGPYLSVKVRDYKSEPKKILTAIKVFDNFPERKPDKLGLAWDFERFDAVEFELPITKTGATKEDLKRIATFAVFHVVFKRTDKLLGR